MKFPKLLCKIKMNLNGDSRNALLYNIEKKHRWLLFNPKTLVNVLEISYHLIKNFDYFFSLMSKDKCLAGYNCQKHAALSKVG